MLLTLLWGPQGVRKVLQKLLESKVTALFAEHQTSASHTVKSEMKPFEKGEQHKPLL